MSYINIKHNRPEVRLISLKHGGTFLIDGKLFIKLNRTSVNSATFNCLDLSSNDSPILRTVGESMDVAPVDIKMDIIIKN